MFSGNWRKVTTIAAAIGAITATYAVAFNPSMQFAVWQEPPGTLNPCVIPSDMHRDDETGEEWHQAGEVMFEWVENSEPTEWPKWSRLRAHHVELRGESPSYGSYVVRLDPSRPLDSRLQTIGSEDFPLSSTLTFHATLTFDEQPGVQYQTTDATPVAMHNPALDHWPHAEARYDQQGPVTFVNPDNPEQSITLVEGTLITVAQ